MPNSSWSQTIVRLLSATALAVVIVAISAIAASRLVTRQIAELIRRRESPAPAATTDLDRNRVAIDFYSATGIRPAELRKFFDEIAAVDHLDSYPAHLSFWNSRGECLIDEPIEINWASGHDRVVVGQSGILRIMLRPDLLEGLTFGVPPEYRIVRQHTIPIGSAYEPYAARRDNDGASQLINDFETSMEIWRQLARQKFAGIGLGPAEFPAQIRRTSCTWRPPGLEGLAESSSETICRVRRDSVVALGHLMPDGSVVHAAGVVVDSAGVIATAYHVIDKPHAVARCVLTADGKAYPVEEILAADRPHDVALVRIKADGLAAAPLSNGVSDGAPLTIISHPGGEFYSVTEGVVRRRQAALVYGVEVEQIAVTADFADGASGGPAFNQRGEIAGIVSHRRPSGSSETAKIVSPAAAILGLCAGP